MFGPLIDFVLSQFYLYECISSIVQMKYRVCFQPQSVMIV